MNVVVVDAGSTSVRAAVVSGGRVLASSRRRCDSAVPPDAPTGREWDPAQLWDRACDAIRSALTQSARRGPGVDAVVATSQRLATVFLDDGHEALYAGPNTDARGFLEALELQRTHGDRLYDVTGHQPPIVLVPARVQWFRRNRPSVEREIRSVATLSDWLAFRIGGELASEPSVAGDTGLLDVRTRSWDTALAADCGVDPAWLPPLRRSGEPIGAVTAAAEGQTGLPAGVPVHAGAGDTMAALYGMDVVTPGAIGIVAGSTLPVDVVAGEPLLDPARRCWTGCHAAEGRWVVEANGSEAGIAQEWLARLVDVMPEALHVLAARRPPATAWPAVLGPGPLDFSDLPLLRFGELRFLLPVGMLGPSREDLARAFVDNLAYAMKAAVAWLPAVGEGGDGSISLGGGLAESALLPEVVASVLDRPVRVFDGDTTVAGAARLVTGETASGRTVEPRPEWAGAYAEGYGAWSAAVERLHEGVQRFSALL